jgi:hypothetical protein
VLLADLLAQPLPLHVNKQTNSIMYVLYGIRNMVRLLLLCSGTERLSGCSGVSSGPSDRRIPVSQLRVV